MTVEVSRTARLVLCAMGFAAGVLCGGGQPATAASPPVAPAPAEGEPYPSLDSLFTLYQPYLGNISAYEPIYFLVGTDPEKSSFQVSFKYRLLNPNGSISRSYPWAQGLHLAYTQTSFWDLQSSSKPFEDTSYKPEVFLITPNASFRPGWLQGVFFKTGFQHESNGQGAELSRSTNFLYGEPIFVFYDPTSRLGLALATRAWVYVANDEETNPDIEDYRGYFQLETKLGRADTFVFDAKFRWAAEGASLQADLTYPIHRLLFDNLDLYLQIQYANVLAESLLGYEDRTEAVRVGISLVR